MVTDFRSDLRAKWLRTLVSLGIYPVRDFPAIEIGQGVTFRPDFYLPAAKQYLVIVPVLDLIQERILGLAADSLDARPLGIEAGADMPIVALGVAGIVTGFVRFTAGAFEQADGSIESWHVDPHSTGDVALIQCGRCDGWYFADASQGWRCQVLGCPYTNAGDVHIVHTPMRPWPLSAQIKRAS